MNKILCTVLTLLSVNCFAQEWADYKVDDNLTVYIPDDFDIIDTLDQHIIRAQIDNALIMIQRIPNEGKLGTNVRSKDELIENYVGFNKGMVESQAGTMIGQKFIEKNGLHLTQFDYHASMGEEKQIRHCLTIFVNENWYAIQFWEVEEMTDALAKDREMLFSSIKFPDELSLEDQMSYYKVGYQAGQILVYLAMIGIVVLVVVLISKRTNRKSTSVQR